MPDFKFFTILILTNSNDFVDKLSLIAEIDDKKRQFFEPKLLYINTG